MSNPEIAARGPFSVQVQEGRKYVWCACGRSGSQPFCDGKSHLGTGLFPVPFTADKSTTIFFCGCKLTRRKPLCDGSHARL
ncbi:MAG: CDGSH iron-sulfur domain-containing protein [Alphaproteobacteria bacterium]